jgi:2-polyprenyl-6-methoxyphenol hydroxylase-like FAD-dependent oxidoreductase
MSPFQGEGANMAMLDAMKLATAVGQTEDVDAALASFEGEMLPRARKKVLRSRSAARHFHAQGRIHRALRNALLRLSDAMLAFAPQPPKSLPARRSANSAASVSK